MNVESQFETKQFTPLDIYGATIQPHITGRFIDFDLRDREHPDNTLYNVSIPFYDIHDGKRSKLMMVRKEPLDSEDVSEVVVCDFDKKQILDRAPVFELSQDPYYLGKFIDANDEFWQVIGMVKLSIGKDGNIDGWNDVLYRYKDSIMELSKNGVTVAPWMAGVSKWKDLRFLQLDDGILVTPRPQGEDFGGLGQVGQFMTKNLDTLPGDLERYSTERNPESLISGLFAEGHWGAINQYLGRYRNTPYIAAVGHDAHQDKLGLRQYIATCFLIDLQPTGLKASRVAGPRVVGNVVTIATADDYPDISPKPGHGLGKIIFPAGIVNVGNGPELFTGVADRNTGRKPMDMREISRRLLSAA